MIAPSQHTDTAAFEHAGLGKLSDGWVWATIGLVTENFDGRRVPVKAKDRAAMRGPYPYYGASGVIDSVSSYLFDGTYLLITEDGVPISQAKDVAFMASGKFWVNNHAHVVKALGDIPLEYLTAYANSANLQGYVSGTTRLKLTQAALNSIPVPLAPLPEQHRIVEEIEKQFTRLDASLAALKRVRANLKRYRASVLKAACEGRLVPTEAELAQSEGRDYESADQLLGRIVVERRERWESQEKRRGKYKEPVLPDPSTLPDLPDGWVWASVGQLSVVVSGQTPKGIIEAARSHPCGTPWYRVGDMNAPGNETYMLTSSSWIMAPDLVRLRLHARPPGTIVFPKRGGAIATNKKRRLSVPAAYDLNTMGMIPVDDLGNYLWWWFQTIDLSALSDGSNVPQINHDDIQDVAVPLPPLAEQHRIVAEVERRLSVIQQTESAVEANLARAERLRQSILKQAFSGKLVPQDPDDEPASVLLERIRAEREAPRVPATPKSRARGRTARSSHERQLVLGVQEKTS